MRLITKLVLALLVSANLLIASQARQGIMTFVQGDGETFKGLLKGDSSFHWIESNGKLVMYDVKDKSYYNALLDPIKGISLSKEKPRTSALRAKGLISKFHKDLLF